MMTLHVVQSGSQYMRDHIHFEDEEGLIVYLRARGVTHENIIQALEALAHKGKCTIQQA